MRRFSVRVTPANVDTRHVVDAESKTEAEAHFRKRIHVTKNESVYVWQSDEKFESEFAGYKGSIGWR